MTTETAILIAAGFATTGWLWTGRRARNLARKQHTITVMLQASLNEPFRLAMQSVGEHLRAGVCPNLAVEENQELRNSFRMVLNHYEFIAAGLRNGDFDERLVKDSERGTIVALFKTCKIHIFVLRETRNRQTIFENLQWLYDRWEKKLPGWPQRVIERLRARPFVGRRVDPHA